MIFILILYLFVRLYHEDLSCTAFFVMDVDVDWAKFGPKNTNKQTSLPGWRSRRGSTR